MNEKQVKKWAVISIILCYVFLMVPVIVSMLNTSSVLGEIILFATLESVIGKVIVSALILSLLILLIYSDNVIRWFDKTEVGK